MTTVPRSTTIPGTALALLVALLMGVALAVAPPADAVGGGKITYSGGSMSTLSVCKNWGTTTCLSGSTNRGVLRAGQSTHRTLRWADADGFFIPSRCTAYAGTVPIAGSGRWVKITNLSTLTIRLSCW